LTDNKLTEGEIAKLIGDFENDQDKDWEKVQNSEKNLNQKIGKAAAKKKINEIGIIRLIENQTVILSSMYTLL
jgi:hypothetical protein